MRGISSRATLIISVYKDVHNLRCILAALRHQTRKDFEVIVSEDGESEEMARFVGERGLMDQQLQHLTQPDGGFRKTRAMNRAIMASQTDILIFIDGDCVPHPRFIEGHITQATLRRVSVGRRVELGPNSSRRLMSDPDLISSWSTKAGFMRNLPSFHRDGTKNPEAGIHSNFVHRLRSLKKPAIVGCNFSLIKADIERINGFNEDFVSIGTGEDTDLDWRLSASGCVNHDVKYITPLFHLFHERDWPEESTNGEVLELSRASNCWRCVRGLDLHDPVNISAKRTANNKKYIEAVLL